ncbi:MAG: retaining beta-glycosidase [Cytophagales bacterium]|nr:MAG: retaining beta-glycosidase [Cytophagales bacterium]
MRLPLSILLSACLFLTCRPTNSIDTPAPGAVAETPVSAPGLVHREGRNLVQNGKPVLLNGVAFSNWVWDNKIPTLHHNEADFAQLNQMGLNCVRFYLNYQWFEDDLRPYTYKQAGWDWLDQNIAWAKKNNVYLILNVHVPQGGYQSQSKGTALWDVPENQNRLAAWWKAIAKRYASEPTIAGYDLVNEPVTTKSIDQWKDLVNKLIKTIREVDTGHLIVVERLNGTLDGWRDYNGERNMFLIPDENVLYQFHTYDPFEYTHQQFSWANRSPDENERYPDETKLSTPPDLQWYTATFNNPAVVAGTSGWNRYTGVPYRVSDPKIKLAFAVCQASGLQTGQAIFDDILVREFDESGVFVRDVLTLDLNSLNGWYFWSKNGSGKAEVVAGQTGNAIRVGGTTDDANVGYSIGKFRVRAGYSYQISGSVRGENVPSAATVKLRVDFETTNQPILTRNKAYLKNAVQYFADWGQRNNVPMYLGEFGAGAPCFQNNRGGLQWTEDMIDINRELGFHTTYHAYHEDSFGWFFGQNTLPNPANANTPLIELFRRKFGK